jgi:hypothetical protein
VTQTTGYSTFRVISENVNRGAVAPDGSATQHWFHPGITAVHYAEKTRAHIRKITSALLSVSIKEPK